MAAKQPDKAFGACEHRFLPLNQLRVHPQVQRTLDEGRAKRMAAAFDPDLFGEATVVRHNGVWYVIDGQHRTFAARIALGEQQSVPCAVYPAEDMTVARAARIFVGINGGLRKAVRPIDLFRQNVRAGEPAALGVKGIVAKHGLAVEEQRKPGQVQAVAALLAIYRNGAGAVLLDRTVRVLKDAWGEQPDAYHAAMLRGLATVLERYGSEIEDRALAHKLAGDGAAIEHVGMARTMARGLGCSVDRAMAQHIIGIYNKGRRSGRLPDMGELA